MNLLDLKEIGSVTLILFSVIDILGAIPVILEIKKKSGRIESGKATWVAGILMITFLYLGERILHLFGVDIQSFALAGAIVIFIIGMEMILGHKFFKDTGSESSSGSIVPLAFPIIAGAGTLTTLISLRSQFALENIIVGVVINLILVFIVLKSSQRLENLLGDDGLKVLGKIFGIVLLTIAIKIITTQIVTLKTNLQDTVEKIEETVQKIENMHQRNLILMERQDSVMNTRDTVVVERILHYRRLKK